MSKADSTTAIRRDDLREFFTYRILKRNTNLKRGDIMKAPIELSYNGKIFKSKKKDDDEEEKPVGIIFPSIDMLVLTKDEEEEDEDLLIGNKGDKKLARPLIATDVTMCLFVDKKSTNLGDALRIKEGKFLHPFRCMTNITIDPIKGNPICQITYSFGISNE